jgi:hypothetical protein
MMYAAEIRMATGYLLNQVYGARYNNPATIQPAPLWCNFEFFSEIRPSKINHLLRLTPQDEGKAWGWLVSREVQFFHRGKLVAEIRLSGMEFDRRPDGQLPSMWKIVRVLYAARFDHASPEDWQDRRIDFTHYASAA